LGWNCSKARGSAQLVTPVDSVPRVNHRCSPISVTDNLGVPKNPLNPFYDAPPKWNRAGKNWIDPGLGGFLAAAGYPYETEWGKHKVPTLRNVDKRPLSDPAFVKAFGHNGYFKSLKEIVHFYNTRDVPLEFWPAPEVEENINTDELGDLGLTDEEEDAIVAFLQTLSDE